MSMRMQFAMALADKCFEKATRAAPEFVASYLEIVEQYLTEREYVNGDEFTKVCRLKRLRKPACLHSNVWVSAPRFLVKLGWVTPLGKVVPQEHHNHMPSVTRYRSNLAQQKEEPMEHSNRGASGAHRWMPCPGSVNAEKDYPRDTNVYAAQGTAAHELAEKCLRVGQDAKKFIGKKIKVEGMTFEVDGEMARGVQLYLDVVREDRNYMKTNKIHIETKVDLTKIHPGLFGTNDAALCTKTKLNIYDFKYGRGVVQAEDNVQLLYYALGALLEMDPQKKVEEIEMIIVQPRVADPVKRWTVSRQYLKDWAKVLRAAAIATEAEDAPRIPGEKQCQWCKHRSACKELESMALEKAMVDFDEEGNLELPNVSIMGDNALAEVLRWSPFIKTYLNAIESKALSMLEAGEPVSGYKLVDKRPVRKWTDPAITIRGLVELGLDDDDMFKEPVLLSPAQMEKLLTKDQRAEMAELVVSESSGYKMVPDSDPADEVSAGTVSDFADD